METNGKVAQIEALLRQGVTKKQLVDSGFSESTVRKAMKRLEKQGETPAHDHAAPLGNSLSDNHSTNGLGPRFPLKLSSKEIIPAEAILSDIRLQDGEYKLGFVDGIRTLMGVQWMVYQQVGILQGLASAQAEIMESQLRILHEAKGASSEVAAQAAQEAAISVAKYFDETKPWLQAAPNPMASMMVDLMKPVLQNLLSKFIPGFQPGQVEQGGAEFSPPPGFTYKEEKESD